MMGVALWQDEARGEAVVSRAVLAGDELLFRGLINPLVARWVCAVCGAGGRV